MKTIITLFLFVGILVSSKTSAQEYIKHATTNVAVGSAKLYYKVIDKIKLFKLLIEINI